MSEAAAAVQVPAHQHNHNHQKSQNNISKIDGLGVNECLAIYKADGCAKNLTDDQIMLLIKHKHIQSHQLEKSVGDFERGVAIR